MRTMLLAVAVLWLVACTDESEATRVLRQSGYTHVRFTGYQWFACSDDDWSHTGFTAKGPTGVAADGVVCCGLFFKSCTVRQ